MSASTPTPSEALVTTVTPAKRKFYEVSTITIQVGESKRAFHVHVDLLRDASPVFETALSGTFKDCFKKGILLPKDDERIFGLFVDWLYSQRYEMLPEVEDIDASDDDDSEDDEDDEDDQRYQQAFRLFVLADKYKVSKLKNLIIEALFVDGDKPGSGPSLRATA